MAESLAPQDSLGHSTRALTPSLTARNYSANCIMGDVTLNSVLQCGKHL